MQCGSSITNNAAKVAEGDCSMTCSGNSTQYCGGANRLTVYGKDVNSSSSSSTTTGTGMATGTSTTGSVSSTSATGGPTAVPSAGGFASLGCYTEATSGRALGDSLAAYDGMTVEKCAAFCSTYTYMALEYMSECYCGNTIGAGAVPATEGCTMACSGNAGQLCGGSFRLNFYKKGQSSSTTGTVTSTTSTGTATGISTSTTSSSTGPAAVQTAGTFAYQGCYSEGTNVRALAATNTASGTMTVEVCAAFCNGYTYMGVEYSSECFVSDTGQLSPF